MFYPVQHITQTAFGKFPFNILTACTHERYESSLAKTGNNFYAFFAEGFKPGWNAQYAEVPNNYIIFDKNKKENQILNHLRFDMILSQNKFGQYQIFNQLQKQFHIPLISLEHTLPMPSWDKDMLKKVNDMRGDINIFISDYSIDRWNWERRTDTYVINHALDTKLFCSGNQERKNHILTVANDYIGRDWCLNFTQYKEVCLDNKLPVRPIGDTKDFSLPAKNTEDLVNEYQTSRIFLNTAHISPIPTSLLEAMSCGCAVVSCNTCAVPEYIEHGVNGFLANNNSEMLEYLHILLQDEKLATKLGKAARKTIQKKCSLDDFVSKWNKIFQAASSTIYLG